MVLLISLLFVFSIPCSAATKIEEPYCEGTLGLVWGMSPKDTTIKLSQNNFTYKRLFDLLPREETILFYGKIEDNDVDVDVEFFDDRLYSIYVSFTDKTKAQANYDGLKAYFLNKYGSPTSLQGDISWLTRQGNNSSSVTLTVKDGKPVIEYLFIPTCEEVVSFRNAEDKKYYQQKYGQL